MQVPKSSFRFLLRAQILAVLGALTGFGLLLWAPRPLRSDNFIIYQPESRAALPLQVIEQTGYIPLLPALNAVGKVGAIQEKRDSLKVWFDETEIEVRAGDKRVRLGKARLTLSQPVRKPGSQWLVPVEFLAASLPQLVRKPVDYKLGATRLFIGNVRPIALSFLLEPKGEGVRITVQLSEKVNVRTTATDGKWVMYLGERPVQPVETAFRFQDPYVSEIRFDDQDGLPKLVITPATGGLNFVPTTAEGGKVHLADVYKPTPAALPTGPGAGEPAQADIHAAPGAPEVTSPESETSGTPGPPLPIIVLDAAHGGDDLGARGRDGVLEKDITARLAAQARLALLATRKYRIQLTRAGDVNPAFEQREIIANTARPVAYLSFHAGNLGNTTPRVAEFSYRSIQPEAPAPASLLVPWNEIHRFHAEASQRLAGMLQARFAQVPGLAADAPVEAPVLSLRSIDAPAVAIEVGSLHSGQDSGSLTSVVLQQQIATAIVAGLEGFRAGAP